MNASLQWYVEWALGLMIGIKTLLRYDDNGDQAVYHIRS